MVAKFGSIKLAYIENALYFCDNCKKEFNAKEVKFESIEKLEVPLEDMKPIMYINERDEICVAYEPEKTGKALCCPYCKTPHFFGFGYAEGEEKAI